MSLSASGREFPVDGAVHANERPPKVVSLNISICTYQSEDVDIMLLLRPAYRDQTSTVVPCRVDSCSC